MKSEDSCETGIALMHLNLPGPHPAMIMGDTFLRSYYSVYNHENGQIGFANANHEHGEKIPLLVEETTAPAKPAEMVEPAHTHFSRWS